MTEPMDEAQAEMMQLEYELGYSAGHIAGVRAMYEAEREAREQLPALKRPSPWLQAGYWTCVLVVVADSLWTYLDHNYTRVNAFEDGIMLMSVFSVWSSGRRRR